MSSLINEEQWTSKIQFNDLYSATRFDELMSIFAKLFVIFEHECALHVLSALNTSVQSEYNMNRIMCSVQLPLNGNRRYNRSFNELK